MAYNLPWKLSVGTLKITQVKRKIIWTKPSFSGCMLIFQGVAPGVASRKLTFFYLKMDGWKTMASWHGRTVSFREGKWGYTPATPFRMQSSPPCKNPPFWRVWVFETFFQPSSQQNLLPRSLKACPWKMRWLEVGRGSGFLLGPSNFSGPSCLTYRV